MKSFSNKSPRYDRDNYVTLNKGNIPPKQLNTDFNLETQRTSNNYGVPYDYGSLMHYSAYAFAKDERIPTLIPKDENYVDTMGSTMLSFYDILLMNKHYGCLDKCKSASSAKCKMGGYPNPRDCSKCICPDGYGGRLCDEKPSGCGLVLTANSRVQTLEHYFGPSGKKSDDFTKCHFWIKADRGRKVEIRLKRALSESQSNSGCAFAGVEIKPQKDQLLTGYRFCKEEGGKDKVFVSKTDTVPVIFYRSIGMVTATLEYRMSMF
ncbi:unnamed protein product [Cylicocyclus nassatus]|uniref:Metalloendopeptidase n=1 Tax=Cylicocyclus nassatus TaxID=53992 RepID=A0AA36HBN1_CYLNA|nr:unnamed protein product [Cylicocyclus nassatus]